MGRSVTNIGSQAFLNCSQLVSAVIPNGVTSIAGETFFGCSSLVEIDLSQNIDNMGVAAFSGCSRLTNIALPRGITSIEDSTFAGCSSLVRMTLPRGVTNVADSSFAGCTNLTQVTLPSILTTFRDDWFKDCHSLVGVYFEGNAPAGSPTALAGAAKSRVYYLPGTTGWKSSFGGQPTVPWSLPYPVVLSNGTIGVKNQRFGFNIAWVANQPVRVEACTDLGLPVWIPISTNTLMEGTSYFSDPQWADLATRIYRLRAL
jgi:hypothetical protein